MRAGGCSHGCHGCHSCHCCRGRCHLRSRAAPAAPWICAAGAPGSSCRCRGLRRADQPARKGGGAAGGAGRWLGARVGRRRSPGSGRGSARSTEAGAEVATPGTLSPAPALGWSLSLFFFFFFGQAWFSELRLFPRRNPEGRSRWPLWLGLHHAHPLRSAFSIPAIPSTALETVVPFRVGRVGGN